MSMNPKADLGAHVSIPIPSTNPAAQAAGTVNGTGIDRTAHDNPMSAVLYGACGAASGTPTTQAYDVKLQDSADNSTFADITGAAITQIVADSGEGFVDVNLTTARRYIRVVRVVAFTGGSTPALPVGECLILGGGHTLAQAL